MLKISKDSDYGEKYIMEMNNPVNRLVTALEALKVFPPDRSKGQVLYRKLGEAAYIVFNKLPVESEIDRSMARDGYQELVMLCFEAGRFVDKNSGNRSKDVNLRHIDKASRVISSVEFDKNTYLLFSNKNEVLDDEAIDNLHALADNLRAYGKNLVISEDKIAEICNLIDEIIEIIVSSEFGDIAKNKLIDSLNGLRSSVIKVNFLGDEAMVKELEVYLGRLGIAVQVSEINQQQKKTLLDKTTILANTLDQVVSNYNKVYPIIQPLFSFFGVDLPQLPPSK